MNNEFKPKLDGGTSSEPSPNIGAKTDAERDLKFQLDSDIERIKGEFNAMAKENFDAEVESKHLRQLLNDNEVRAIWVQYKDIHFIKAGGSGMVFEVTDKRSNSKRALKIARNAAKSPGDDPNDPVDVNLEIEALSLVNHQNVTRFYDGLISIDKYFVIVTQLVESPLNIAEWVAKRIGLQVNKKGRIESFDVNTPVARFHTDDISDVFLELTQLLHGYASALSYMHESLQLFHMDIKHDNLLVDGHNHPFVTDLGFARSRPHYNDNDEVPVGFTFGFHHPYLEERRTHLRIRDTFAKARAKIPATELGPKFDVYAFGRTILYLLKLFECRFGERIQNNYNYLYLHLLATLLLDARNVSVDDNENRQGQDFVNEIALGIEHNLLRTFKIVSFPVIVNRLERLLGMRPIEYRIPELNPWYPRSLNNGHGYLNVTPRIEAIIGHPAFRRLREASQLGVISDIYPNATHTRHAHSLGVAGLLSHVLQALYHDEENPIFRVLVQDNQLKEVIISSLIHDVGQSEFGHELEEIDKDVFDHAAIGKAILHHPDYIDQQGRTVRQIVEGTKRDEWASNFDSVLDILNEDENAPHKYFTAFNNLISGPIDVDKIDYLRRDGGACDVSYSDALDLERFLKCITILPVKIRHKHSELKLGIKEKGLAASEAIAIARRQLYQAVYLQHTVRAIKAMVLTACAQAYFKLLVEMREIFDGSGEPMLLDTTKMLVHEMYVSHLICRVPKFATLQKHADTGEKRKQRKSSFDRVMQDMWHKKIVSGHFQCMKDEIFLDRSITFFWSFMNEESRRLISDYLNRNIYKRLSEVSFQELDDKKLEKIRGAFAWEQRQKLLDTVTLELKSKIKKTLESGQSKYVSLNENPTHALAEVESLNKHCLVVDLLGRDLGTGGTPPPVLKDISRKHGEYSQEVGPKPGVGHIWKEGMEKMMKEISVCRIYCEPRFYELMNWTIGQENVNAVLREHIPGWH